MNVQGDNLAQLCIPAGKPVWFKVIERRSQIVSTLLPIQLKCLRCGLECGPVEIDPTAELTQIEGSPAGAHLVIRCKDCRSQGNISKKND